MTWPALEAEAKSFRETPQQEVEERHREEGGKATWKLPKREKLCSAGPKTPAVKTSSSPLETKCFLSFHPHWHGLSWVLFVDFHAGLTHHHLSPGFSGSLLTGFLLPPLPPPQSNINSAARGILLKTKIRLPLLCSKLPMTYHLPQRKSQSPCYGLGVSDSSGLPWSLWLHPLLLLPLTSFQSH